MDDFLILKRTRALDAFVPMVVTASLSGKESARRALTEGAFDFIPTPLEHEQKVRTIRLALWQSKLRDLITCKEKAVDQYRQHLAKYPEEGGKTEESFIRALAAVDKTIHSIEHSILRVEESAACFADFATEVEFYARKGALERLDALSK